jgi:hypothetical protein
MGAQSSTPDGGLAIFAPTGAEAESLEDGEMASLIASFQVSSGPPIDPNRDYPDFDSVIMSYPADEELPPPFDATAATQTLRALGYPVQPFAPDVSEPCRQAILKALGEALVEPPERELPALQRALAVWTTGVTQESSVLSALPLLTG